VGEGQSEGESEGNDQWARGRVRVRAKVVISGREKVEDFELVSFEKISL
jgi:hypothetical protein